MKAGLRRLVERFHYTVTVPAAVLSLWNGTVLPGGWLPVPDRGWLITFGLAGAIGLVLVFPISFRLGGNRAAWAALGAGVAVACAEAAFIISIAPWFENMSVAIAVDLLRIAMVSAPAGMLCGVLAARALGRV